MTTSPALIDWQNPRTDHWAWDSMVLGLMAVPGRKGWKTSKWQSLDHRKVGTLTNMDPATDWVSDSPVGGWGSLESTAGNAGVDLSDRTVADFGASDFAIGIWFYSTAATTRQMLVAKDDTGGRQFHFQVANNSDSGKIDFTVGTTAVVTSGLNAWSVNKWNLAVVTRLGSSCSIFVNGQSVASASAATITARDVPLRIGARSYTGFIDPLRGFFSSATFWNRGFSDSQVAALYEESRRGYPHMLRRLPTRRYFAAPAVGGFQPWFARNSTTVIGASGGFSA